MKKTILALAAISCLTLSLTGCPSPTGAAGGDKPGTGTSTPGTGASANAALSSKAAYIAYLNCVKVKVPQAAASIDASIAGLSAVSDAQWNAVVTANPASYEAILKLYTSFGC